MMRRSVRSLLATALLVGGCAALPAAAEDPATGELPPSPARAEKAIEPAPAPAPALALPAMSPFPSTLPAGRPLMSLEAPSPEAAARSPILACNPPAPSAILFADCCQKGNATYVGKHEFCYCAPQKFVSVCRLGPGSNAYPNLIERTRCQTTSTHPYWPSQSSACAVN